MAPRGAPARLVLVWLDGGFELVLSRKLVNEVERVLAYPKLARRIPPDDARAFLELLTGQTHVFRDPPGEPPRRTEDPGDDYLVALAAAAGAVLVSGDRHLLELAGRWPVHTPAQFLESLVVDRT